MKLAAVVAVAWIGVFSSTVHGGLHSWFSEYVRTLPGARYDVRTGNVEFVNLHKLQDAEVDVWQFHLASGSSPLLADNAVSANGVTIEVESPHRINWLFRSDAVGERFNAGNIVAPGAVASLSLGRRQADDDRPTLFRLAPVFVVPEPAMGSLVALCSVAAMAIGRQAGAARKTVCAVGSAGGSC